MTTITLTPEQANGFLEDLSVALEALGMEGVLTYEKLNLRDKRTVAEVIRETVLETEEARRADKRGKKDAG